MSSEEISTHSEGQDVYVKTFMCELVEEKYDCYVDMIGHDVNNDTVAIRFQHHPWFIVNCWTEEVCDLVSSHLQSTLFPRSIVSMEKSLKTNSQGYSKQNYCHCLKVTVKSMMSYYYALKKLREGGTRVIPGSNYQHYVFNQVHTIQLEIGVDQKLKFLLTNDFKYNQWLHIKDANDSMDYNTRFMHHYRGDMKNIRKVTDEKEIASLPNVRPCLLSFDGEMYSSAGTASMPIPSKPRDDAYLFTVCVSKKGNITNKYAFTHMNNNYVPKEGEVVVRTKDADETLLSLFKCIQDEDPDIILGHNIYGWDNCFIDAKMSFLAIDVPNFSRYKGEDCELKDESWSSSAHKKMEVYYFKCKGRIWMDMLPYTKRYHKLRSYTLKYLSKTFLDLHKIDLTPEEQFKLYESGDITKTVEYGLVDAIIPIMLFEKFNCWDNLLADSNIRNIDIFDIYSRGQGVGGFNQTYTEVHYSNYFMTMISKIATTYGGYKGALVLPAIAGYYRYIMTFDFSGMYPAIIMAYNICFSTLVTDSSIPDEHCHVFDIPDDDHPENPPTRYRFIRKEYREGILPKFLRKNKEARNKVKALQKTVPYGSFQWKLLELQQLNIKLSSNGVYGLLGSHDSKFYCLPGAACVTFIGRQSLDKVQNHMKNKWHSLVVTGDSDSVMVYIPGIEKYIDKVEKIGTTIAKEISDQFPEDIVIEFEKIWEHFVLFSKKHYVGYLMDFLNKGKVIFSTSNKYFHAKGIIKRDTPEAIQTMMLDMCNTLFQYPTEKGKLLEVYKKHLDMMETNDISTMVASVELGDVENYKSSSASSLIFYNNMKAKGKVMKMGDRVEYFLECPTNGGRNVTKGDKMNLLEHYKPGVTRLDFKAYINLYEKKAMKVIQTVADSEHIALLKTISKEYKAKYL